MKPFFIIAFLCLSAFAVTAQGDSTRYIFGLPVTEDDTATEFPQRDLDPANRYTPVAADQLPSDLREALETGEQYAGWKDSTIYYQKNTGLYMVPIRYEGGVKLFGLTEKGHPVTYNEITVVPKE